MINSLPVTRECHAARMSYDVLCVKKNKGECRLFSSSSSYTHTQHDNNIKVTTIIIILFFINIIVCLFIIIFFLFIFFFTHSYSYWWSEFIHSLSLPAFFRSVFVFILILLCFYILSILNSRYRDIVYFLSKSEWLLIMFIVVIYFKFVSYIYI